MGGAARGCRDAGGAAVRRRARRRQWRVPCRGDAAPARRAGVGGTRPPPPAELPVPAELTGVTPPLFDPAGLAPPVPVAVRDAAVLSPGGARRCARRARGTATG